MFADRRETTRCSRAWLDAAAMAVAFRNMFHRHPLTDQRTSRAAALGCRCPQNARFVRARFGSMATALWSSARFSVCVLGRLGCLSYDANGCRVRCFRPLESWGRDSAYSGVAAVASRRAEIATAPMPTSSERERRDSFFELLARPSSSSVDSMPSATLKALQIGHYPPLWAGAIEWQRGAGLAWVLPSSIEVRPLEDSFDNVEACGRALVIEVAGVCRELSRQVDGNVAVKTSTLDTVANWPYWRNRASLFDLVQRCKAVFAPRPHTAFLDWWLQATCRQPKKPPSRERAVIPGLVTLDYADRRARGVFLDGVVLELSDRSARALSADLADLIFPPNHPPPDLADHLALIAHFKSWAELGPSEREHLAIRRANSTAKILDILAANQRFGRTVNSKSHFGSTSLKKAKYFSRGGRGTPLQLAIPLRAGGAPELACAIDRPV